MSESAGAKNAYQCSHCNFILTTINRAEGVTPFMLGCRNPAMVDGCPGMMRSFCYRLPPGAPEPTWEWYRPDARELKRLKRRDQWQADHVERGGLLLREIETAAAR